MIVAVKRNLCNCVKKPEKNSGLQRGLNPWPRDTGAMLYQLSYEATDIGSRSIVGSYVPVKEMSVNDIWNESYMNCGNEMKWRNDRCSETQFMQLRKEAWKKNSGLQNPWPRDYQCDGLPSYEATDIGSWSIVGSYVPVKEVSVNDIWNKSYMNAEKEMKWRNNRRSEMQFMQLRKEAWKKFRTSTGFEPVTSQ